MTESDERGSSLFHKCPECEREFDTPGGVNMHKSRVHGKMGPGHGKMARSPYAICQTCGKRVGKSHLQRHVMKMHPLGQVYLQQQNGSKGGSLSVTTPRTTSALGEITNQDFTIRVNEEGIWLKVTSAELVKIFGSDQWSTT